MSRNHRLVGLYNQLQSYARLYTFRDPNVSCLFDLRVNECYVLDYIANHDPLTVTQLAQVLGIHKSNISRIVNALESAGLVQLVENKSDARTKAVELTAAGSDKHSQIQAYFVDRLQRVVKQFSASEIDTSIALIAALTDDATERIREAESTM